MRKIELLDVITAVEKARKLSQTAASELTEKYDEGWKQSTSEKPGRESGLCSL